jgi:predicted transposase/invertase (TIGR01784 family)
MDKILSAKSDYIFKLIFGDQRNDDILAAFLQSVLDLPESDYDTLTIVDPHVKPEYAGDKFGILDVKLKTKSHGVIDIEIQVAPVLPLKERIIYYLSKMVTEQIDAGQDYTEIKRVISIVITDFVFITQNEIYHNKYKMFDPKTGSVFTDKLEINTLELPKLPINEDKSELWHWMRFMKSEEVSELEALAQVNKPLSKAVEELKRLSADEEVRRANDAWQKMQMDTLSAMNKAKREGMAEGAYLRNLEIAKAMLTVGEPWDKIFQFTGVSQLEISNS